MLISGLNSISRSPYSTANLASQATFGEGVVRTLTKDRGYSLKNKFDEIVKYKITFKGYTNEKRDCFKFEMEAPYNPSISLYEPSGKEFNQQIGGDGTGKKPFKFSLRVGQYAHIDGMKLEVKPPARRGNCVTFYFAIPEELIIERPKVSEPAAA